MKASGWALFPHPKLFRNKPGMPWKSRVSAIKSCGIFRDPHRPSRQDKAIIYYSSQEPNKDFAQKLVQTFNWILLTAAETRQLREELLEESQSHPQLLQLASLPNSTSGTGAKEVKPLFLELLEPWFHNPASALALCLLACTWLEAFLTEILTP